MKRTLLCRSTAALAIVVCCQCSAAPPAEVVEIRLPKEVRVSRSEVRLQDIAELTADSASSHLAEQVAQLDLLVLSDRVDKTILRTSVIDLRLQLAGFSPDQYRLVGPGQVVISKKRESSSAVMPVSHTTETDVPKRLPQQAELSDLLIENTIRDTLATEFQVPSSEISTRLLRPFIDQRLAAFTDRDVRVEVIVPSVFPLGRSSLVVRLWEGRRLVASGSASADVRRRQQVLVARKRILPFQPVTADMIERETRFVDTLVDEIDEHDIAGKALRRSLQPGQVVAFSDILPQSNARRETLVNVRDSVRIVARRGRLRFEVPAAEALQSGAMGQLIKVRNVQSNKIITARVAGRGLVEVPL